MKQRLRIAQIAPLAESVPPKLYGGTERVVSYLTEALVEMGHDVTLFASGDSVTQARLIPCSPCALRLSETCLDPLAHHVLMLERVMEHLDDFDVIHAHIDYLPFPLMRRWRVPTVTTLHGRLDIPDLRPLYDEYRDIPLVSISNSQRKPLAGARWVGTVYHGMELSRYKFTAEPGDYVAFLGRVSPEKRLDSAIRIATQANVPLKIAAKVDTNDKEYFDHHIVPMLDHPLVEFIGEIGEHEKSDFLGNARALIFMVDWPEPFGLAMIEAMACGTPVIARRRGSIPEVVDDGITGYVCDSEEEAIACLKGIEALDRRRCRSTFERRFSVERMAQDYQRIYRHLVLERAVHSHSEASRGAAP